MVSPLFCTSDWTGETLPRGPILRVCRRALALSEAPVPFWGQHRVNDPINVVVFSPGNLTQCAFPLEPKALGNASPAQVLELNRDRDPIETSGTRATQDRVMKPLP